MLSRQIFAEGRVRKSELLSQTSVLCRQQTGACLSPCNKLLGLLSHICFRELADSSFQSTFFDNLASFGVHTVGYVSQDFFAGSLFAVSVELIGVIRNYRPSCIVHILNQSFHRAVIEGSPV